MKKFQKGSPAEIIIKFGGNQGIQPASKLPRLWVLTIKEGMMDEKPFMRTGHVGDEFTVTKGRYRMFISFIDLESD